MEDHVTTGWTGWVAFAGILLMFEGIVQAIYGLGALFNQNWYVMTSSSAYLVNIKTWGWATLAIGALLFLSGALLIRGNLFGRTMGIFFVVLGLLANLSLIAVAPVWSLAAIVLYALAGYAILAHGKEMKELAHS